MALRDVIGQDRAVDMLRGILQKGRLASSYLFCGESGIGKKMTAVNFARAINCLSAGHYREEQGGEPSVFASEMFPPPESTSPNATGGASGMDSCDACASCIKFASGTHPDFLMISPEERQIRIEEIRMIDEALSFKPFEGRMKVVVVDDAEMMNPAAANAFLKTLEEPPAASVIILVSSRPELLPATIRSRCSRILFSPLPSEACRRVLEDRVPDQALDVITRLSMGRPGLALSADLIAERDWFLELLGGMLRAEKDAWSSRDDMERWLDLLLIFLRDMTVFRVTGSGTGLINGDLADEVQRLAQSIEVKGIIYIYRELSFLKGMSMFNLNKSVTWNYTSSLLRKEMPV